jgi:hypothetical protein
MARTKVAPVIERLTRELPPPVASPELDALARTLAVRDEERLALYEELRVQRTLVQQQVDRVAAYQNVLESAKVTLARKDEQIATLEAQLQTRTDELATLTSELAEVRDLNRQLQRRLLNETASLQAQATGRPQPLATPPRSSQGPRPAFDRSRVYSSASPTLPPTPTQVDTLEQLGLAVPATSREASELIAQHDTSGLRPTDGQVQFLTRRGYPAEQVPATRGEASSLIDQIKRDEATQRRAS